MTHEVIKMVTEIVALTGLLAASATLAFTKRRGHGISILIPFRANADQLQRLKNVVWLKRYWKAQLPGAEIIIGKDPQNHNAPFSKSVAVNDAARKAKGDIFVIVDADGYISVDAVLNCVKEIRDARKRGRKLWFVPYRKFYRLTEAASHSLLQSDPKNPLEFSEPLTQDFVLGDTDPTVGHWYGAMIQICPREAFDAVGGWDERFRGWGGEDHAAMRAMDTLYGLHMTLPGHVLHVWHPQIGPEGTKAQVHWKDRMWAGQDEPGVNDKLAGRYYGAYRNPEKMRKLVDEGKEGVPVVGHHHKRPHRRSM
jgi:Glycosyltransferase like family 2